MQFEGEEFGRFIKALEFSAEKHKKQLRKGEERTPYINHPIQVAKTLWEAGETSFTLLVGALLHDTIEDTQTTPEEIETLFGKDVLDLVLEVTDDKNLPYQERKRLQIVNAPHKSVEGKLLKLADKICNINDLVQSPPDWTSERKLQYLEWAAKVVEGLRGVNAILEAKFDALYQKGKSFFL